MKEPYHFARAAGLWLLAVSLGFMLVTPWGLAPVAASPNGALSSGPFAYVAMSDPNVKVIDMASNAIVATIAIPGARRGDRHIAVNAAGTRAYVTNYQDNTVSVIDTRSNTLVTTIAVGQGPWDVAITPTGSRAYVANCNGGSISVIDTAANTVVSTVPVNPCHKGIAVNPAGSRVYATHESGGTTVSVLDTATNAVIASIPVGQNPNSVTFSPDGARAYVTNFYGNSVSVIDTATNAVTATIPLGWFPWGITLHPTGSRAYATNFYGGTVWVIDTAANAVVANVYVGGNAEYVTLNPTGTRAYVTTGNGRIVAIIDTATNTRVGVISMGDDTQGIATVVVPASDSEPPAVTTPAQVTAEATSAAGAVVTYSASAVDAVDGPVPVTCTPNSGATFALGDTTVTCTATDAAGNTGSKTFPVTIRDTTPPAISGMPADMTLEAVTPAGSSAIWPAPTAADAVDGAVAVTCLPASGTAFALGTTPVACSAADAHGNTASASFTVTVRDTTLPVITLTTPGASAAGSGWYNLATSGAAGVTVQATAADSATGVTNLTCRDGNEQVLNTNASAGSFTLGDGAHSISCTAMDGAGNAGAAAGSTAMPAIYQIDQTPPTVTGVPSRSSDHNGWYNHLFAVAWHGSDTVSNLAGCSPDALYSGPDTATGSLSGGCTDNAGNSGGASFGFPYDATPPTVTYTGNAGTYTVDQQVDIACTAGDAVSGVDTTDCVNLHGAAYTFALGANTVAATATDQAGNAGSGAASFTVQVTYGSLANLTWQFVTKAGVADALSAKLNAAEAAAARGNANAKAGAMGAYLNEVRAQSGKSLNAEQASILIRLAGGL